VKEFNAHLLKPIRVSVRDGKFYVFDGQHRVNAMKILKETHIMCELHHGLTFEDEAWLFAHQNDNEVDVSPIWKFNALVKSGDADAVLMESILSNNKFHVAPGGGNNKIQSVNGLYEVYNLYGAEIFNDVFYILRNSWDGDKASLLKGFICGLALFIKNNPNVDKMWLIKNLSKTSPITLKANAELLKNSFKDISKCYENQFSKIYDYRKRKSNAV
jgi:hypothetical protein